MIDVDVVDLEVLFWVGVDDILEGGVEVWEDGEGV